MTNDSMRLLEGIQLDKLTAEQAIQEIQRIAGSTLGNMSAGYYVDRLAAIGELARVATVRLGKPQAGAG